jgi:tetratricopeptide (TPR) repeat protein
MTTVENFLQFSPKSSLNQRFTMKQCIFIICLFFMPLWSISAQENDYKSNFEKGLNAYNRKEYAAAVKFYEASLSTAYKSPEAYNNLGLAYYKTADIGRAILSFERALRIKSNYGAARKNLRATQQYVDTEIKKSNSFWLFSVFGYLAIMLSSFSWSLLFFLLFFSASAAFLVYYLKLNDKFSFVSLRIGIILLPLSLFCFGFARTAAAAQFDKNLAIITAVRVGVRTAPGLDGEDIIVLSSGVKVKIQEEMGDWYKIRLENAVVGWLPSKTLEKI